VGPEASQDAGRDRRPAGAGQLHEGGLAGVASGLRLRFRLPTALCLAFGGLLALALLQLPQLLHGEGPVLVLGLEHGSGEAASVELDAGGPQPRKDLAGGLAFEGGKVAP
jgi:hypothetical protein